MFSKEELNNLGTIAREELNKGKSGRFEEVARFEGPHPAKTRTIWRVIPRK